MLSSLPELGLRAALQEGPGAAGRGGRGGILPFGFHLGSPWQGLLDLGCKESPKKVGPRRPRVQLPGLFLAKAGFSPGLLAPAIRGRKVR